MKPTKTVHDLGQSLWLDNITRGLLNSGTLQRYIDEFLVTGLTSNPTIFDHAIRNSADYDSDIAHGTSRAKSPEDLFFNIALADLIRAADLFRPIFERTDGVDGWVSLELSPSLAYDTQRRSPLRVWPVALALSPTGTWYTAANRAQVRIGHCDRDTLCGGIVWLKDPIDPKTVKPWTDINNSELSKRSRPLVGTQIVLGLKPSASPNKWQGQVYNADDGRTYSGDLKMTGPDALEMRGCVLGGIICKSETWTRAR